MEQHSLTEHSPRIVWSLSWTLLLLTILAVGLAWVFYLPI
jgi:hypothetical protein